MGEIVCGGRRMCGCDCVGESRECVGVIAWVRHP